MPGDFVYAKTIETKIFTIPKNHQLISRVFFDESGKHFAYVIKKGDGEAVVYDGKEGGLYYAVLSETFERKLVFSSSGEKLMYATRSLGDGREHIMLNNEEFFSPDQNKEVVHYGFSPDGKHTYFIQTGDFLKELSGKVDEVDTLYIDGAKVNTVFPANQMLEPHFINDKVEPIYWSNTSDENKRTLVIGANKIGTFSDMNTDFTFSGDGKRFAFVTDNFLIRKPHIVIDGKEMSGANDSIEVIFFSPDSKEVSYIAKRGGSSVLVRDGKEFYKAYSLSNFVQSPNSKRFAVVGQNVKDQFEQKIGNNGGELFTLYHVNIDNKKQPTLYTKVSSAAFSFDSQHYAYVAEKPDGNTIISIVVRDGKEQKISGSVDVSFAPVFSYNGKHIVYLVRNGPRPDLYFDQKKIGQYDQIENITFSKDNSALLFNTKKDGVLALQTVAIKR